MSIERRFQSKTTYFLAKKRPSLDFFYFVVIFILNEYLHFICLVRKPSLSDS